jgi:hypothetical protein
MWRHGRRGGPSPLEPGLRDLGVGGELAGDDLAVDGIGDGRPPVGAAHQPQVDAVLKVVGGETDLVISQKDRLDDAADAVLAEFVGELVEVAVAAQDEGFLGGANQVEVDGAGAVFASGIAEADLVGESIDEPGLTAGEVLIA